MLCGQSHSGPALAKILENPPFRNSYPQKASLHPSDVESLSFYLTIAQFRDCNAPKFLHIETATCGDLIVTNLRTGANPASIGRRTFPELPNNAPFRTTKRGLIVPATREAPFYDRTLLILNQAAEVLGFGKDNRLIGLDIGRTEDCR